MLASCMLLVVIYLNAIQLAFEKRRNSKTQSNLSNIYSDAAKCINENIQIRSSFLYWMIENYMIHLHHQRKRRRRQQKNCWRQKNVVHDISLSLVWPNWLMEMVSKSESAFSDQSHSSIDKFSEKRIIRRILVVNLSMNDGWIASNAIHLEW